MHRCLLVPEICGLICSELAEDSKRDLASLARTSRSFQEPALYHLWYKIGGVAPLIRCMPRDLWKVEHGKYVFRRAITKRDWKIFQKYALRVRIIHPSIHAWRRTRLSPREYRILDMAAGQRAFLPNITTFIWSYEFMDETFPFMYLFLGPKLTTLRVQYPVWRLTSSDLSVIANLGSQNPALTTVEVVTRVLNLNIAVALSTAICRWNDLRCLEICVIPLDALVHIGKLPSLQVLQLGPRSRCHADEVPTEFPHNFPYANAFPSLRTLAVLNLTFPFCIQLLNSISSASLQSISLDTIRVSFIAEEWSKLLSAIQTTCRPSSLLKLAISDSRCTDLLAQPDHTPFLTKDHIRFLLDFHNLKSVELQTRGAFDIYDGTVREIAAAWPKIETLSLIGMKSGITLAGLLPLVEHCPELGDLTLEFDARSAPPMEAIPRICSQLRHLHVLSSPIRSCNEIAAFLFDLFPKLEILDACGSEEEFPDPPFHQWMHVRDLLGDFESVRAQAGKAGR